MSFLSDLDKGRAGEKVLWGLLDKCGFEPNPEFCKTQSHDIECKNPPFTIEVKNDFYAKKSGNIAIEVFNPKKAKPSGLTVTQADLWAHIAFDQIYITSVKSLKNFVEKVPPLRTIGSGGDDNATLLLFQFETISPIFKELNHDDCDNSLSTILELLKE